MTFRVRVLSLLLLALLFPRAGHACGGLVFSEESPGSMVDQEVLIASGVDRTVLLISVGYSGAAEEFAFLLPLQKAPLAVYDGDQRLFAALAERTAPRVRIMNQQSSSGGSSGCCGSLPLAGGAPRGGAPDEIEVIQRGETTTYQYVVVGGKEGGSLQEWLEKERFAVPKAFQGALDEYIKNKWLFLAARLKPKSNRGSLAPIEIQLPAIPLKELRYPFELSAQSVPPTKRVDVLLYLMSIAPMLPANYDTTRISKSQIRALTESTSNYKEVSDHQLAGGTFLLEAGQLDLRADEIFGAYLKPDVSTSEEEKPPPLAASYGKLFPEPFSLLRLHARLGPANLHDMQFRTAETDEMKQDNVFVVLYSPGSAAGAFGFLLGISLLRRRSRRNHSIPKRDLFSAKNST